MTRPLTLNPDDHRSLAWLCEMAAIGCLHENRSAWAAQLRDDAKALRQQADAVEGRTQATSNRSGRL